MKENENKKETRGGKRSGAGRPKSGTESKVVTFRVKNTQVEPVRKVVKEFLKELK
jgi:hypothetical protein